jgi:LCP family protein required for cell wall assembly
VSYLEQYAYPNPTNPRRISRRRRRIRRALAFGGVVVFIAIVIAGFQGWRIVSAIVEAEKSVVVPLPTRSAGVELGGAANSDESMPQITPGTAEPSDEGAGVAPPTATVDVVIPPDETTTPIINVTVPTTETGSIEPSPTSEATRAPVTPTSTSQPSTVESTPTPVPTIDVASLLTPAAGIDAIATVDSDGTGGPDTTPEGAPVATSTPRPTVTPTVASVVQPESSPQSVQPTAGANDSGDDNPSTLDVVRQVLGQGFNSGDPGTSEVWDGKTTLNILVVGLDRRPDGGDQNADVIIIAQIDLVNAQLRAVSIPRDLLVEIPGFGYDKINSAYNHGIADDPNNSAAGVGLVRDTIEYNFGVPIDDYVLVDFSGFTDVVDAVGGIDVNVPYDIYDPEYPTENYGTEELYFPAGETEMDGDTALKYVRTRHADSDDQRRERQLQVLRAIFTKGKSLGSVTKIDNMILALGDSAQTSFPLEQQLTLARLAMEMGDADITLSSLAPPLIQGGTIDTGAWVYSGDMGQISQFVQDSVNGTGNTASGG